MKKSKAFFFLLLIALLSGQIAWAIEFRSPEIHYPSLPFLGVESPNIFIEKIKKGEIPPQQAFPLYVKYIYGLSLVLSCFIALGAIIYGGFQYLISLGAPAKLADARSRISGGILGLVILLSSYLILTAINPQLVTLSLFLSPIEKCDCTKEPAELSDYCKIYCQKAPPVEEEIPIYIEIPLGRLIERVIKASEDTKKVAEEIKTAAEGLEKRANELKRLTDACACGNIRTICPDCSDGSCLYNNSTDCPNVLEIKEKQLAVEDASGYLEFQREEAIKAKLTLDQELFKLEIAESLMRDSLSPPMSYESFIGLEQKKIRKLNHWQDVDIKDDPRTTDKYENVEDPATFYVAEEGNQELIETIESISPGSGPNPDIPWEPGPSPLLPNFEAMVEYARFASEKTGVRASLLLALLYSESGYAQFPGKGHYPTAFCCSQSSWWQTNNCNNFEAIWKEVGYLYPLMTLYTVPVSAAGRYCAGGECQPHCGGAMGPAQAMSYTWKPLKEEVKLLTGKSLVSPWEYQDAFVFAALHLKYYGNAQSQKCNDEATAAWRYMGGHREHANRLVEMANGIAEKIGENKCSSYGLPSPTPEKWQLPVKGFTVLSSNSSDHLGRGSVSAWDFTAPCGTGIYPAKAGTVTRAGCGNEGGYGCWVEIDHGDGWLSRYGHMLQGSIKVSPKEKVSLSTTLGNVGCTGKTSFGPHTHMEILNHYKQVDPATIFGNPPSIGLPYRPFCVNHACPGCGNPRDNACFKP